MSHILGPDGQPCDAPKTIIPCDAKGNAKLPEPGQRELKLVPFPDGKLLRYQPHPNKEGLFLLVTGSGEPVGVAMNLGVADFLCRAADCFIHFIRQAQEQEAAAASVTSGEESPACAQPELKLTDAVNRQPTGLL